MTKPKEEHCPMFILDVLKYDIEQLPSILRILNHEGCYGWKWFWGRDFTREEVVRTLPGLIKDGLIAAVVYSPKERALIDEDNPDWSKVDDLWFRLTPNGQQALESWDAPAKPDC